MGKVKHVKQWYFYGCSKCGHFKTLDKMRGTCPKCHAKWKRLGVHINPK